MKPEMIMAAAINLRTLKTTSLFASTDETRYYLNGVLVVIEPRAVTYVATDGHCLFARREEKISDPEGHPDNDMTGEFIIPTEQCRAFNVKKNDIGTADIYGDKAELTIKRFDGSGVVFKPIDGTFPDWRRVIPSGPLAQGIGQFKGDQVVSFKKAADELSLGFPFIAHNGASEPALVRFNDPDTIGVIMPVRSDDARMKPIPVWAQPMRAAAE